MKSIGECGLAENDNLKSIVIPASVERMGRHAIRECPKLRMVEFKGNAPELPDNADIFLITPEDLLVVVPDGSTGWGEDAEGKLPPTWQDKKIVRKSEYEKIAMVSTEK